MQTKEKPTGLKVIPFDGKYWEARIQAYDCSEVREFADPVYSIVDSDNQVLTFLGDLDPIGDDTEAQAEKDLNEFLATGKVDGRSVFFKFYFDSEQDLIDYLEETYPED